MGLDLILYWKTHNYQKVILLNLKMSLCAWWPIFLLLVLFKIYFKSLILRFEIFSGKTLSVIPVFTALILLLLFQIIKIRQCCGFNFTILFFFLMATNALATSWLTFSNARIIECSIWFSHGRLMKINSTHVYFRSRIMLYSNDEKQR